MADDLAPDARAIVAAGIRSHRGARGWSQGALAERVGLHQATVSTIEKGERGIDVNDLFLFAEAFGIPVVALFREAPKSMRQKIFGDWMGDWREL